METDTQTPDNVVTDEVIAAIGNSELAATSVTDKESPDTKGENRGSQNSNAQPKPIRHANAFRRITDTNKQLKSQVAAQNKELAELRRQISDLQKSNKPEDNAKAGDLINKAERILDKQETYQGIIDNGEVEAWEQEAYSVFGDNAKQFLEFSDKYGSYVNQNEPHLCEYIGTPYGMLLLSEWYTKMENAVTRQQWLQMPSFKKASVLANLYEQIEKIATSGNASSVAKKTNNVPAPTGGRVSNETVSPDDLGGLIDQAYKSFGRS